jgi:hypothetical protein
MPSCPLHVVLVFQFKYQTWNLLKTKEHALKNSHLFLSFAVYALSKSLIFNVLNEENARRSFSQHGHNTILKALATVLHASCLVLQASVSSWKVRNSLCFIFFISMCSIKKWKWHANKFMKRFANLLLLELVLRQLEKSRYTQYDILGITLESY